MALFEIKMPKMGESVEEATITKWFVKKGDLVEEDQVLLEIATDKVDSEIPSPVSGKISDILYKENDKIAVGKVIAIIDMESEAGEAKESSQAPDLQQTAQEELVEQHASQTNGNGKKSFESPGRFYSPLVKSIAQKENITIDELESISGSGKEGRVNKNDVLNYLNSRKTQAAEPKKSKVQTPEYEVRDIPETTKPAVSVGADDEVIEMDRIRRLIAEHMVMSKRVSPHVTNVVEADVTNLVIWREKNKERFEKQEKIKLTYMPVFIEAAAKALKDYPLVNASVDGTKMILHKAINIGVAVALPTGNLIVPVIKNAHQKNILGLASDLQRLADNARNNKLNPDDIQGGTFTITNFGTFRNLFGSPIINQPQVAILATGSIQKKPAVLETPAGDVIAIRHKMYLSLTYDHRIVDGALGGAFLRKVADYLEQFQNINF